MAGLTNNRRKKLFSDNLSGFTLMEIIVSLTLFSIIVLASTSIFKMVIDAQRKETATQNIQESLKYFLEVTAKEMRTAQKSDGASCSGIPSGEIFATTTDSFNNDILRFRNYYGQCVTYSVQPDSSSVRRFNIKRDTDEGYISPAKISIDAMHFQVTAGTTTQPMVTISLRASADTDSKPVILNIQTSVTSRVYR